MAPQLTFDICLSIADDLPLHQVLDKERHAASFPGISYSELVQSRANLHRAFKGLVQDTSALVIAMGFSGTILVGSRAVSYFMPGASSADSDWNFICPGSPVRAAYFLEEFKRLGFVADKTPINQDRSRMDIMYRTTTMHGTVELNGVVNRVTLSQSYGQMPSLVPLAFDFSVDACFLAPQGCVSYYHYLTGANEFTLVHDYLDQWRYSHKTSDKYLSKGYTFKKYEKTDGSGDVGFGVQFDEATRTLGDGKAYIVPLHGGQYDVGCLAVHKSTARFYDCIWRNLVGGTTIMYPRKGGYYDHAYCANIITDTSYAYMFKVLDRVGAVRIPDTVDACFDVRFVEGFLVQPALRDGATPAEIAWFKRDGSKLYLEPAVSEHTTEEYEYIFTSMAICSIRLEMELM